MSQILLSVLMSVDKPLEVVRSPKKCRENTEDCTAEFTRDRGQKKQQDRRNSRTEEETIREPNVEWCGEAR